MTTSMLPGWSRRSILKGGAALGAGLVSAPLFGNAAFGQASELSFWQFYAPDGQQPPATIEWWNKMAADWNAQSETKVKLENIVDYMTGNQLSTAFASGQGPDLFLISPGDFLRYYNGGALLDLTPFIGVRQDLRRADGSRADGLLLFGRGLRGSRAQ